MSDAIKVTGDVSSDTKHLAFQRTQAEFPREFWTLKLFPLHQIHVIKIKLGARFLKRSLPSFQISPDAVSLHCQSRCAMSLMVDDGDRTVMVMMLMKMIMVSTANNKAISLNDPTRWNNLRIVIMCVVIQLHFWGLSLWFSTSHWNNADLTKSEFQKSGYQCSG